MPYRYLGTINNFGQQDNGTEEGAFKSQNKSLPPADRYRRLRAFGSFKPTNFPFRP